jgi:hypothetical protein
MILIMNAEESTDDLSSGCVDKFFTKTLSKLKLEATWKIAMNATIYDHNPKASEPY